MAVLGTLFSGGGGFDIGAIAAGLEHGWGLEYAPKIAELYQANIGRVYVQDILESNPLKFDPIDWLHASPVCKAFSAANAKAGETQWDIDCGLKVAEFIRVLQPKYFSLENVQAYQRAKAFHIIVNELHKQGYWTQWEVLNAADFGVPQSRRRLILRAVKGGFLPPLPPKEQHKGWYGANSDLVHDLPDSKLADWQIERLPEAITEHLSGHQLIDTNDTIRNCTVKGANEPSFTLRASVTRRPSTTPQAILIENTGARSGRILTRTEEQPAWTIRAMGHDNHWHRMNALFDSRVVTLSIHCLARLQSFPDNYQWSGHKATDGTAIGNSVPPLMAEKIVGATLL
jgi:DNA (cytosine-5)-methyltransferase 1